MSSTSTPARPVVPTKPDVWSMSATGMQWCDCGKDHAVTEEVVKDAIRRALGRMPKDTITHVEVCEVLMVLWNYAEVCEFFHDQVKLSATAINGAVAKEYAIAIGVEIIAHFTKTWQGCPTESCAGGFGPNPLDL